VEQIKKSGSVKLKVHLISLDLGAFESVRKFAKSVQEIQSKIHILINNAGGK
jgi:short-subunit dehydrogenase